MAHYIEEKVKFYLDQVNSNPNMMTGQFIEDAKTAFGKALNKQFNEVNGKFRISMSGIGRPLCQSMMAKAGATKLDPEYTLPLKMLYGDIIEALMIPILKASGVNVTSEHGKCLLKVDWGTGSYEIPGEFDIEVDGDALFDIKSASSWAFKNKFNSFKTLKEDDSFGYVSQLLLYAKAKNKKPGGWIVVDKVTGEIKVVEVPSDYKNLEQECLVEITNNVKELVEGATFRRQFTDVKEYFRKKETGNRYICKTCEFCDYKFTCWPDLIHSKALRSEAKDPPWKYYTHIKGNTKDEDTVS